MSHKVIAAIWCDLTTNGLGLPSRLLAPFPTERGEILLLRVLRRALKCTAFETLVLLASPGDAQRLRGLALPGRCELMPTEAKDVPQRAWLRKSRKWAVDGWRGGLGWSTAFDEECPPAALWEACQRFKADAVLRLPSHAPFLDPALNAALVDLHLRRRANFQFTFCQAPPGLAGEAFHPEFLETMTRGGLTPRNALMMRPGQEGVDPQRSDCHFDAREKVRNSVYRVSCESPRLWTLCESLVTEERRRGVDLSAEDLVAHLDASPRLWRGSLPREVLADPVGDAGGGDTESLDPEAWQGWLAGLAAAGDSTVTLGVRQEPLKHPRWREFLAGAYGIHLRTDGGALLEGDAAEVLMASAADVVTLRTERPELVERLTGIQKRIGHGAPLLCLEFALSREKEGELPAWWARWHGKVDWLSVVSPVSTSLPALDLAPPRRKPCAKLSRLLYVAPDGTVHPCAEDVPGSPGIGCISQGIGELWGGTSMGNLREAHAAGRWPQAEPPCASCGQWAWV